MNGSPGQAEYRNDNWGGGGVGSIFEITNIFALQVCILFFALRNKQADAWLNILYFLNSLVSM